MNTLTTFQTDLFEMVARDLGDHGMDSVLANNESWSQRGLRMIGDMPLGIAFTGEQLRHELLAQGLYAPSHHNAWGALVGAAVKKGLIRKTGRSKHMRDKSSHGRLTPEYETMT